MLKFQDDYITKNENMEDLFTIILAIVDDLYQIYAPDEIRNRKNIAEARCSDAEIITISIVGEMMGVDSETAWHSFVKKNYSHLFPHLCCRSRYHRRKKNLYLLTELLRAKLEKEMDVGLCENYIADSYPLPVCKFGRAYFCKSFRYEGAAYGRCPSKKETYYGYKVHVLTTMDGYISRYIIGKANEDDREGLYHLTEGLYGITILGDKQEEIFHQVIFQKNQHRACSFRIYGGKHHGNRCCQKDCRREYLHRLFAGTRLYDEADRLTEFKPGV